MTSMTSKPIPLHDRPPSSQLTPPIPPPSPPTPRTQPPGTFNLPTNPSPRITHHHCSPVNNFLPFPRTLLQFSILS